MLYVRLEPNAPPRGSGGLLWSADKLGVLQAAFAPNVPNRHPSGSSNLRPARLCEWGATGSAVLLLSSCC